VTRSSADEVVEERARLMDAALKVMRVNGFQSANVQDILDEAGLSTRAFYRQFRSKDALLLAMFRTASARDVAAVARCVADAATASEAVDAWIDEMLAIAYDRRRIRRLVMFNAVARQTVGFDDEVEYTRRQLMGPLRGALEHGLRDGSFPATDPDADSNAVFDLIWSFAGPQARQERGYERSQAKAHLLRYVLPALGAAPR
jgi:AcrR family transcriptional regulator